MNFDLFKAFEENTKQWHAHEHIKNRLIANGGYIDIIGKEFLARIYNSEILLILSNELEEYSMNMGARDEFIEGFGRGVFEIPAKGFYMGLFNINKDRLKELIQIEYDFLSKEFIVLDRIKINEIGFRSGQIYSLLKIQEDYK